jgi:hypothetical protein
MIGSLIRRIVRHEGGSAAHPLVAPSELPVELWLLIAEFLEPKEKRKLIGVNRLFFELVMDELYTHLSLVSDDPSLFIHAMESLRYALQSSSRPRAY